MFTISKLKNKKCETGFIFPFISPNLRQVFYFIEKIYFLTTLTKKIKKTMIKTSEVPTSDNSSNSLH